jgi:hypothetical protein
MTENELVLYYGKAPPVSIQVHCKLVLQIDANCWFPTTMAIWKNSSSFIRVPYIVKSALFNFYLVL